MLGKILLSLGLGYGSLIISLIIYLGDLIKEKLETIFPSETIRAIFILLAIGLLFSFLIFTCMREMK